MFNARIATRELKEAFYAVSKTQLLDVSIEDIDTFVTEETVMLLQQDRMTRYPYLYELKDALESRFRAYRVQGRVKSLTSLLGKYMQGRTLMDMFGIRIVTMTAEECYSMADWLTSRYPVVDYDDRIAAPKANGYQDLKLVAKVNSELYVEFIIQSNQMYVDSHILQPHSRAYPWKYSPCILNLPVEYREIKF